MLILILSVSSGAPTRADGVCGDGTLNSPPEQCDDDNLANGDGCSSTCTIEQCGNGTLDTGEQCDDGNTVAGDRCNAACQIEFCGDRQIQTGLGEQCDDGNGIGGDGCSSACARERVPESDASASKSASPPIILMLPPSSARRSPPSQPSPSSVRRSPPSQPSPSSEHHRSSSQPSVSAQTTILEENSAQLTIIHLLQRFIASPISTEVIEEKKLRKDHLTDVNAAILELKGAVTVLPRDELRSQVVLGINRLKRQGIFVEQSLPADYRTGFEKGRPPIDIFTMLLSLKEATEKEATNDLPASLETIRHEVEAIRLALPVFQREYGLEAEEAEVFLKDIETVSREVTKQDAYRIASAVKRLLLAFKRRKIIGPADFIGSSITLQAAVEAKRIAEETDDPALRAQSGDPRSFVAVLTPLAPARYREAFADGTIVQQRAALLEFLAGDERIRLLRATLQRDGQLDFDHRFDLLQRQILAVGSGVRTDDPCSVSMSEALRCAAASLQDLQDAVRSRSIFSRAVGTLQDFFGIGS